ncbi:MAG: ribosomal-processing cysteine protease Prp [Firmicutes bacterium]|nr:ribosomal-processing cysteine protease Prp [Bacillota bacterium]
MAKHIKAKIFKKNGLIYGFDIKDHGDPIVCSGVSVLTMNTVNSLEALLGVEPYAEIDDSGEIYFTVSEYRDDKVQLLLKTLELGLRSIEEEYSDDIKVSEEVQR